MWQGRTRAIQQPPIAAITQRAAELRQQGRELLNLGQAILGLRPPAAALAEVEAFLARDEPHGYSPDPGLPEVIAAVTAFLRDHKGMTNARPDEVVLTCGANQAFVNALLAVTVPGDEVILLGPSYFDHDFAVELAACRGVTVNLVRHGPRFAIDFDALATALTPRTRCLVLVSPANPSGMVLTPEETRALCELCAEREIWLLSDETYDLLTFAPAEHQSPAALGLSPRTITLGSFSKIFGLAAWRIGYVHGSAEVTAEVIKVQDALVVCAPVPSQLALKGALGVAAEFCAQARVELRRRRDVLLAALSETPYLMPLIPDGATFIMAEINHRLTSFELASALLEGAGLITVPGSAFGPAGEGYLRLSYGNQTVAGLTAAAQRLRDFLP